MDRDRYGVHLGLLPRGDIGFCLYLYLFYYVYMFNSLGICAQVLCHVGFVQTCSIPIVYVYKFCILTCLTSIWPLPTYSIPIGYIHEWP